MGTVAFMSLEDSVQTEYVKLEEGKHMVCPQEEASRIEYGVSVKDGEVVSKLGAVANGKLVEVSEGVTLPEDYKDNAFLYVDGEFKVNPSYEEFIPE